MAAARRAIDEQRASLLDGRPVPGHVADRARELLAQLEDALWVGKVARALTWQEVIDRLGLETHAGFDPVSTWLLWFLGEEP